MTKMGNQTRALALDHKKHLALRAVGIAFVASCLIGALWLASTVYSEHSSGSDRFSKSKERTKDPVDPVSVHIVV